MDFLQKPPRVDQRPSRKLIRARLDAFLEIAISREPRERLADPSRPEDAELGIILHCQTMKGHVGQFWNLESRAIQLLSAKGLSREFIFGFDWHWRAEESARRPDKTACPTKRWSFAKHSVHDAFSRELLELLPLPWVIIGGGCAKDSYRRTLSPLAKQIPVSLSDTVNLQIELDIQEKGIKRIAYSYLIRHRAFSNRHHPQSTGSFWMQALTSFSGFNTSTVSRVFSQQQCRRFVEAFLVRCPPQSFMVIESER
ncbi:uncharacterized protein A1O9_12176 [Exophiala aquamarina CBS 119918]|uniref:Uncharacterized protein n=1 Tax=Exophiala aquamarina CBS 119918 TaxID=1182545 RepID=A0A072NVF7_9EURO|nr:uncharacterized protein A1O9_12176 [Exophiala aquamarina CBS 119918]KEF51839.1 hypothetical protein A1O9_12176 [Exophiala aquamarina CBS 119918]